MSGDRTPFINLERLASSDLNEVQELRERSLNDALRYSFGGAGHQIGGPALHIDRSVVLGGLVPTPSGSDVLVSAGVLGVVGSAVTPGTLDSAYQMAFLRTPATIAAPTPASDAYYILEGSVVDTTTSTRAVDIYNETTQTFSPVAHAKRIERQVTLRFREGTINGPPALVAGWVPIAVLFRTSGGGVVNATDLFDARDLQKEKRARFRPTVVDDFIAATAINTSDHDVRCRYRCFDKNGTEMWAETDGDKDMSSIPKDAASLTTNDTWHYFYMTAGPGGQLPLSGVIPGVNHRGLLFLSTVEPADGVNSSIVTLDSGPLRSIAAGDAVCVGAISTDGIGSGNAFQYTKSAGKGRFFASELDFASTVNIAAVAGGGDSNFVIPAGRIPANASTIVVDFAWSGDGGAAAPNRLVIEPTGASGGSYRGFYEVNPQVRGSFRAEIPAVDFTLVAVASFWNSQTVAAKLIGWTVD